MDGGPPRFGPGFTCPALLRCRPAPRSGFAYGALTRCGRPSHAVPLPSLGRAGAGRPPADGPTTPVARRLPPACAHRFVRRPPFARRYSGDLAIDFSSSGYLDVSVPPVVLPRPMSSAGGCMACAMRVRPFGDPRVVGYVPLAAAYRSLSRPSSAPCAKASAVRPCHLGPRLGGAPRRIEMLSQCVGFQVLIFSVRDLAFPIS